MFEVVEFALLPLLFEAFEAVEPLLAFGSTVEVDCLELFSVFEVVEFALLPLLFESFAVVEPLLVFGSTVEVDCPELLSVVPLLLAFESLVVSFATGLTVTSCSNPVSPKRQVILYVPIPFIVTLAAKSLLPDEVLACVTNGV